MIATPNRDRVIAALRHSTMPLDDDQLSERSGVRPRQTVNRLCRDLERDNVVRRYQGPNGKMVNELVGLSDTRTQADVMAEMSPARDFTDETHIERAVEHARPPGSSHEQQDAERVMLDLLGAELKLDLEPAIITVPSGARVQVDGADAERTVLVECWAHHGRPKAAQRHKVLSDAFKLTWISSTIYPRPRLFLCLSDEEAAAPFISTARSWAAQALSDLGVAVVLVALPPELRQMIREAQQRQYR